MGLALLLAAGQVDSVWGMAWPSNTIWQKKDTQRNRTRLSTARNMVHIHESRVAKWNSALDSQVPPQQFGGATQSGPKSV